MTLERVVFQQDAFIYGCRDYSYGFDEDKVNSEALHQNTELSSFNEDLKSSRISNSTMVQGFKNWETDSFPPEGRNADGFFTSSYISEAGRSKRRRTRSSMKNKEEIENQRQTHIAVERNRRRQMNDYLAVLRSMMPPYYVQKGDQASIVGGAINFVKELEQFLQCLQAHHQTSPFANFFTFPQYSTRPTATAESVSEKQSAVADVEVTMAESHANIKVSSRRRPKQVLKIVGGLHSIGLTVMDLNVKTVGDVVLYSLSVKVEVDCPMTTVTEIATAVHKIIILIQSKVMSS